MTNAEAIETLRANRPDACFEQLREAVDAAINALEILTKSDANDEDRTEDDQISRRAAIDALDCINGVEEVLRSLPAAQPEDCDTCKHGYFGDSHCDNCRVRYPSHYERRTDEA